VRRVPARRTPLQRIAATDGDTGLYRCGALVNILHDGPATVLALSSGDGLALAAIFALVLADLALVLALVKS